MVQSVQEKLSLLRGQFSQFGIDGFLIPHTDEFGSEYLPPAAERLAWLTGFTGSAGSAIVMADRAMVMTDGRYSIQIKKQVDASLFEICDMAEVTLGGWLADKAQSGAVIGYDPKLHTRKEMDSILEKTKESAITFKALPENPLDQVWSDRPAVPLGIAELFPDKVAGASSAEKRENIAASLRVEKIDAVILSLSDSIAWLLNVRGDDIAYNPLVLSYAILYADGAKLDWFVDPRKIPDEVRDALGSDVTIRPFEDFAATVSQIKSVVQYDPDRSSLWIENLLVAGGVSYVRGKDPCILPKACKSEAEQQAIFKAHLRDGIAITRFLFWLEAQDVADGHLTEIVIADKLEELRRGHESYRGPSFATISGWAANGAIIHYHATPESHAKITGNGLLLLDSGGQYEYGTTDITRTIVIGDISSEMKDRFTRVLKGHISLASARFAPETDGAALDNLARQPLIDEGLNFAHGTGHGVGCFLCVHEEASSISPRGKSPMKPGMLVSNEPGYYKEGEYGIRHENLILCQEDEDGQYYFDTVTCVPFDVRGIDFELLSDAEKIWLDAYHAHVFANVSPFLDDIEVQWLRQFLFPEEQKKLPKESDELSAMTAYD